MKQILSILLLSSMLYAININKLDHQCLSGNAEACNELAAYYYNKKHRNIKNVIKYIKQSCSLGNGTGCAKLGYFYEFGIVFQKNIKIAEKYYSKACKNNSYLGCFNLGNIYLTKRGSQNNPVIAHKYFLKACNNNKLSPFVKTKSKFFLIPTTMLLQVTLF